MKRQPKPAQPKRPTNMTLKLQQSWRHDGEQPRREAPKTPPAPPKAA